MMKKILTLMCLLGLAMAGRAQIDASQVSYWVGSGPDSATVTVYFDDDSFDEGIALIWGVRWDEENGGWLTLADALRLIAENDPRFTFSLMASSADGTIYGMNWVAYADATYSLRSGNTSVFSMKLDYDNADYADWNDWTLSDASEVELSTGGYFLADEVVYVQAPSSSQTDPQPTPTADATINAANILFWVGEGSASAILNVEFDSASSLAWGYRFDPDDEPTVLNMVTAIDAADPRFAYAMNWDTYHMFFSYREYPLSLTCNDYLFKIDGVLADDELSDYDVADGMYVKVSSSTATNWAVPVAAATVAAMPVNSTIDASQIAYWVGTGSQSAVVAINWGSPDTALAWGLNFDSTLTVSDALNAVVAADPRLTSNNLADFTYTDGNTTLTWDAEHRFSYMQFILDGNSQAGLNNTLGDGSFLKVGESAYGIGVDTTCSSYGCYPVAVYWSAPIHPVSDPAAVDTTTPQDTTHVDPLHGPYCGAVGTAGCTAIKADSNVFVAWAATCVVTRGPQDIAVANSPAVTYGTDNVAVGAVSTTDNRNVVSLGDGGSALLSFANPITNGEGYDFAVFENSFDDSFLELAFVEVSTDGQTFVRFPATSLTPTDVQVGPLGSIDPTNINNLAGKYRMGYGTPFDLEELRGAEGLNIDTIRYVRLIDVIGTIDTQYASRDAEGRIVNDPYPTNNHSGGFDLAGVGVINQIVLSADTTQTDTTQTDTTHTYTAVEATINPAAISIWAGSGSNQAVLAVNWAAPDTCLAWGVKWNGTAVLKDLMDTLAATDSRFAYQASGSMIADITYTDSLNHWQLTTESPNPWPNSWMFNINGSMAMDYFDAATVANGDFVKFGDPNSSDTAAIDDWGYPVLVWTTTVTPAVWPATDTTIVAVEDASFAAADILYWVGQGSNQVVMAINWADTALAWGYRFEADSVTVADIVAAVTTADPRLAYEGSLSYITDLTYADATTPDTLRITPHDPSSWTIYWNLMVNHESSMLGAADKRVGNGDFVKWADTYIAVKTDSTWHEDYGGYWEYTYAYPMAIHPVSVPDTGSHSAIQLAGGMQLSVYPNPASSRLNVAFEATGATTAVLYDMAGRQVLRHAVAAGSTSLSLNVEGLPAGLYMLRLGNTVAKVAVKR